MIGCVAAGALIIVGAIVGISGPKSVQKHSITAYECPLDSHIWSPDCKGKEMRKGEESKIIMDFEKLSALNRFISIYAKPVPRRIATATEQKFSISFTASVDIKGTDTPSSGYKMIHQNTASINLQCEYGSTINEDKCESFTLTIDDNIEYSNYQITTFFVVNGDKDSSQLGDVIFTMNAGNPPYGNLELALNILFVLSSAVMVIIFMYGLYLRSSKQWTIEQRLTLYLTIATLIYNNPMLSFKYIVGVEWFFNFCDSFFKDVYVTFLLVFWSILINRAIKEDWKNSKKDFAPKLIIVGIFFILITILHIYVNITIKNDPTMNSTNGTTTSTVLLVFASIAYTVIIVWACVESFLAFPTVFSSDFIKIRFLFIAVPSSLVMIAQLGDLFSGNFASLSKTSFQLAFYYFLFNTYAWVMVVGFWPVSHFIVPPPDEEQTSSLTEKKN
eukprot:TRINITY_DN709_c2_g3_i1.p1 TRINITY_DN709_c2_g3~~TRINITY_DN709_c2_g3_i1.p1  ORF type:complete len:471 (+),score=74.31 TRINITY_DN709_c2_g3_i1:80-1414(+)